MKISQCLRSRVFVIQASKGHYFNKLNKEDVLMKISLEKKRVVVVLLWSKNPVPVMKSDI